MCPHMCPQVKIQTKELITNIAPIGPLARVHLHIFPILPISACAVWTCRRTSSRTSRQGRCTVSHRGSGCAFSATAGRRRSSRSPGTCICTLSALKEFIK